MRNLLARRRTTSAPPRRSTIFCYRVRSGIGTLSAVLGGPDSLVFSAGIGENSGEIRRRICDGLEFLGIALDPMCNSAGAPLISPDASATRVRVIRTDEESMIATDVMRLGSLSS